MREIKIDGKEIRIKATPLALLFYKQAFNSSLLGDMQKLEKLKKDPSKMDGVELLQITWAMAKADKPKDFPSFETWLGEFESVDFSDPDFMAAAMEEAADGFSHRALQEQRNRKSK